MNEKKFEPTIVAFCCHYCAYSAADLAGSMRLQYPSNIRIIRTPCTGRLDVELFLRAFEDGADGVIVAGCEEGSCHFKEGNLIAKRRVNYTRQLMEESGLEMDRLRMVNVSAANAPLFSKVVHEMVETVLKLGPSRLKKLKTKTQQEISL
jgi:F420-non-reducing hydrogenase iron-sulfur subunit